MRFLLLLPLLAGCDIFAPEPVDPCANPDAWVWTPMMAGADTVMLMGVCVANTG